ncbi:UNVERIFIED_CONTAM: hypothetical protein FKN15_046698 [Acipenser sinensis]
MSVAATYSGGGVVSGGVVATLQSAGVDYSVRVLHSGTALLPAFGVLFRLPFSTPSPFSSRPREEAVKHLRMSGCRVFIGRLSPHARERDVEKFFKGFGHIREVNLKNGFGFVHLKMSGCRVFIGRLSPHARERDVEKFFKGFGHIKEINLKNGFGFVEFDDLRDAEDAVYELNGKELCSERVTIEHARSRRGRGGGRGGGGSGGGGGGGGGGRFSPRFSSYRQSQGSMYGPPVRTEHRIVVENLSSRISWQDLKDMMRKVGEVTFVDAHRSNKNEGVVEFASHSDMKNALDKLDGTELNGRKLKLTEERKRK